MKKIAIIDVSSYIFRAYHALPPMTSPEGDPVNAIYGFISMYFKTMERFKGFSVIAALDSKSATFRKKKYPEYKANRKEVPPELTAQFKYIDTMLDALGVKRIEAPGFEADDIIASIVKKCKDSEVVIVSSDKDLMQLADDRTILYDGMKNKIIDPEQVEKRYGVAPEKMRDLLALMGDSSDNIPGVPGIGPKTGATLLNDYGSIEEIYKNIDSVKKESLKTKLLEFKDQLMISRELVTLIKNIEIDISGLSAWGGVKPELFAEFASKLGFRSLLKKTGLESFVKRKPPSTSEHREWREEKFFLVKGEYYGIFSQDGFYIGSNGKFFQVDMEDIPAGSTVYSFDIKSFLNYPFPRHFEFIDLQIAYFCHDSGRHGYSEENMASIMGFLEYDSALKKEKISLIERLKLEIDKKEDKSYLVKNIEMPNLEIVRRMEEKGISVDIEKLKALREEFSSKVEDIGEKISAYAGFDFNPNSPKQLGEVLFEKLGLPSGRKTKSGYSTGHDVLENLASANLHPLPSLIIEYREYSKLLSTYVEPIIAKTCDDGRLRTTFIVTHAATGRLASRDPNLQNIPVRTEEGRKIRGVFKAKEGFRLVSLDYSQIELRILASLSKDKELMDAFISGEDIHSKTASAIFRTLPFMVDENMRRQAKAVNFGILYGMQAFKLSQDTGVDIAFARQYIDNYFDFYTSVKDFLDNLIQNAKKTGYVETIMKRRRYIPELNHSNKNIAKSGERMAVNSVIQGSAADIIKMGTIAVHEMLGRECPDASILLQIHDELIVEIPENYINIVDVCADKMICAADFLEVPVRVNSSYGLNWGDLK